MTSERPKCPDCGCEVYVCNTDEYEDPCCDGPVKRKTHKCFRCGLWVELSFIPRVAGEFRFNVMEIK